MRTLLILDGLEPLQQPPGTGFGGEFKDPAMTALLRGLAANNPGLCLLTSRVDVEALTNFEHDEGPCIRHRLDSLDASAARALLQELGVKGPDRELDQAASWFHRHAYDLNLLGNYLSKCTDDADIRGWEQRFPILREDERIHPVADASRRRTGHGRRMLRAYERWLGEDSPALAVLRLLGLFDRPAQRALLDALRAEPVIPGLTDSLVGLPDDEWQRALADLTDLSLITREGAAIDSHPLLREHFGANLRETPDAWQAAHRRLYEHLCETTDEGNKPALEDLQPLYQAITHGCHAGLQQRTCDELYRDRILRRGEAYSMRRLGAFGSELGAVACFFESPWSRVSRALIEPAQVWVLSQSASSLQALGRLAEALSPMRAGLDLAVEREYWSEAAILAGNLSELELTLGEVSGAVSGAERSVTYAARSRDAFERSKQCAKHADALHQSGRRVEAESLFREAEQMQVECQPYCPLLYSAGGFRYCDLLLSRAEREAWCILLEPSLQPPERSSERLKPVLQQCRAVTDRATQTLKWLEKAGKDILSASLDHVTLSRAVLYELLLSGAEISDLESQISNLTTEIEAAVSGLRRAGHQDELPKGLLTRAWQRSLLRGNTGPDSAQSDLDEAWEIASRGPMPLFLADIHLHRARLFGFSSDEYPWQSPEHDLAEARRLIEKHGYGRRREELEDAEEALRAFKQRKLDQQPAMSPSKQDSENMTRPKVFISYSHDSEDHRERVLGLSERLRKDGIETILDRYVEGTPKEGWPRWMLNGLDSASHVLCVCTETYYKRFRGLDDPGKGKGADWEGAFITQALYDAKSQTNRFIPILYNHDHEAHIPEPLRGESFHLLSSEENYSGLYDQLLGQAGVAPGEIGELKTKLRATGTPATFGNSAAPTAEEPKPAAPAESAATRLWREKLEFLLVEEAVNSDPEMRFTLRHRINEARKKIQELEGNS